MIHTNVTFSYIRKYSKFSIGRKFAFISVPLSLLVKHRGITHSIFPVIGLYFLFDYLNLSYLALSMALGYVSHLLGDGVSKEGINILYPFSTISIRGFFGTVLINIV
ncbi:metal-dependent hydrolase [Candidatus Woesearchaeota archaeon]|nr:metal-dependent hydrolase [Candidatus Woesearchaeota archaeon]